MKAWIDELTKEKVGLQIAPLIDVVFLLLIYFMVSAQLKRPEADLVLALPGEVAVTTQVVMPDEQIIVVDAAGVIRLNNQTFSGTDAAQLAQLKKILIRYKAASDQMGQPAAVMIDAHDDSIHERVIDVLNLCAAAKIEQISFGSVN